MKILQVSTTDMVGGSEKVAFDLFQAYRARGYQSLLAVGFKRGDDPDVLLIPNDKRNGKWSQLWCALDSSLGHWEGKVRGTWRLRRLVRNLGDPLRLLDRMRGVEDFRFPGTWALLSLPLQPPDIIHCHNLHGGYFDLRALQWLSQKVPVVLTLHDAWLLSGHCAHSFDCERWKTGCGQCPDLNIYPAISRDATRYNWRRKQSIFSKSLVYVSTPSRWLMNKVDHSILRPGIAQARVIPNGVDLTVFHPVDKGSVRAALNLPQNATILLFAAHKAENNRFKDYSTMEAAVRRIAGNRHGKLIFICLGGNGVSEHVGDAELRFTPYQKDPRIVAQYYQAADFYMHASRADTFPCAALEALACATPVIATAVGGIPEQIKGLSGFDFGGVELNRYSTQDATGVLVPAADSEAMAQSVQRLLNNQPVLEQMSRNASKDARDRFSIEQQAERYLEWYAELKGEFGARATRHYFAGVMPQPSIEETNIKPSPTC